MVKVKRFYEPIARGDGRRILVERLWPRGIAKDDPRVGEWLRDVAPSADLRRWYGHDPSRWAEFRRRYRVELRSERRPLIEALADRARRGNVTLVYAGRDTERNSALVVRNEVEKVSAA
jgi:uncharacterized protein YeaO (DUF488 family)